MIASNFLHAYVVVQLTHDTTGDTFYKVNRANRFLCTDLLILILEEETCSWAFGRGADSASCHPNSSACTFSKLDQYGILMVFISLNQFSVKGNN